MLDINHLLPNTISKVESVRQVTTCHMHIHYVYWDPDAPVQECKYLANLLNNKCIRLFCPYCASDNHSSHIMRKLEDRIHSLETQMADVDVSTCHSYPARNKNI